MGLTTEVGSGNASSTPSSNGYLTKYITVPITRWHTKTVGVLTQWFKINGNHTSLVVTYTRPLINFKGKVVKPKSLIAEEKVLKSLKRGA